ncbi:MAG: aspartate aminotransferase, partial [Cyanobium sp.]
MVGPSPLPAQRLGAVLDPVIPRLVEWMRLRSDALSLAQGMVGWEPPPGVLEAVREALEQTGFSLHRYGSTWGEPALWDLVAQKISTTNGVDREGAAGVVSSGGNVAFAAVAPVGWEP